MNYKKLEIIVEGNRTKILLDGVEVENWRSVVFEADSKGVPELTLKTIASPARLPPVALFNSKEDAGWRY